MSKQLPSAIFLMGPTASGKTELAIDLVERYPCDIISVDSALVYRDMDVGTAKPSAAELQRAPHRLINICDPTESYSAARFRQDALAEMAEISAAGRIPLLAGGTMLYFHALQYGLSPLPPADVEVRERLSREAEAVGWRAMHQRLAGVDPQAAARVHPNDPQRIQRALEVFEISGVSMTELQRKQQGTELPFRVLKVIWAPYSREQLHERIARRFHLMLEQGFESEVRKLLEIYDLNPNLPSMRSVGYRQMLTYLRGECGIDEMAEQGIIATRQLAKRQMTWLRREQDAVWLSDKRECMDLIGTFLD